ncbi:uncharacterized protein A4U43_C08F22890 [Asparagus officinalis]|nr:uncharacterized protein A4U43_C08F22890 [Asparagus officinalis]
MVALLLLLHHSGINVSVCLMILQRPCCLLKEYRQVTYQGALQIHLFSRMSLREEVMRSLLDLGPQVGEMLTGALTAFINGPLIDYSINRKKADGATTSLLCESTAASVEMGNEVLLGYTVGC